MATSGTTPPNGTGLKKVTTAFREFKTTLSGFVVPNSIRISGFERTILDSQQPSAILDATTHLAKISPEDLALNFSYPKEVRGKIAWAYQETMKKTQNPIERLEIAFAAISAQKQAAGHGIVLQQGVFCP